MLDIKKKILISLFACCLFTEKFVTAQSITFVNPILSGFYADPSIVKAGTDYYLVNSTFSYFPGLPVFHSKDLKNWKQVGNVISKKEKYSLSPKMQEPLYYQTSYHSLF